MLNSVWMIQSESIDWSLLEMFLFFRCELKGCQINWIWIETCTEVDVPQIRNRRAHEILIMTQQSRTREWEKERRWRRSSQGCQHFLLLYVLCFFPLFNFFGSSTRIDGGKDHPTHIRDSRLTFPSSFELFKCPPIAHSYNRSSSSSLLILYGHGRIFYETERRKNGQILLRVPVYCKFSDLNIVIPHQMYPWFCGKAPQPGERNDQPFWFVIVVVCVLPTAVIILG